MVRKAVVSIACLALVGVIACRANAAQQAAVQQATKAADDWLKLVDGGKYAESWAESSTVFKDRLNADGWGKMVGPVRQPLGPVLSRKLKTAQYATSLPGAPDGQYVVIQYDTSFEKKKSAVETITPMLDKDGQWRVSGYYIK